MPRPIFVGQGEQLLARIRIAAQTAGSFAVRSLSTTSNAAQFDGRLNANGNKQDPQEVKGNYALEVDYVLFSACILSASCTESTTD